MELLTEMDELQAALSKIDMDYEVMPFVRGKLCESDTYNKMQKILDSSEMIKSHNYIYNLDPEQLSEEEKDRVNKIYDLGVSRGFIEPFKDDFCGDDCCKDDVEVRASETGAVEKPTEVSAPPAPPAPAASPNSCWTVLYSACNKNGDVKTGECYSNSLNPRSAKADCLAKLERAGYTNISILAIEAGDPDACYCSDEKLCGETPDEKPSEVEQMTQDILAIEDDEVEEDEEELDESGNPYLNGMKTSDIGGVSSIGGTAKRASKPKAKKIDEDDEDADSDDSASEDASSDDASSEEAADSASEESTEDTSSEETAEEDTSSEEDTSDDSSSEESDSSEEDASAEEDSTEDDAATEDSEEETSDEETSDAAEDAEESTDDESSEDASEEDTESTEEESSEDSEAEDEDAEEEEDSEESSEESEEKEELSDDDKAALKPEYKKIFKDTMLKCEFEDKCFDDLSIAEKVDFFTALGKAWKKNDPKDFLSDKEIEQLNKVVVKK